MVVRTAPTSTTNITGFLIITRGSSLRNESKMARDTIFVSVSDFLRIWATGSIDTSENLSGVHQQVLQNRPQTKGWKKRECTNNQNGGNEQATEEGAGHRKSPCRGWDRFLLSQDPRNGHDGDNHEEAPEKLGCSGCRVVPHRISIQAAERR